MIFFRLYSCVIRLKNSSRTKSILSGRIVRFVDPTERAELNVIFKRCLSNGEELSVKNPLIHNYVEILVNEFRKLSLCAEKESSVGNVMQRLKELKPVFDFHSQKQELLECLSSLHELNPEGKSKDNDLQKQIEEEKKYYIRKIEALDEKIISVLLPHNPEDAHTEVMMEINAGVGGQEAMLFAQELFDMYCSYVDFKGWTLDGCDRNITDIGGLRQATLYISGVHSFKYLKHEAGVHRVQRVPATEKYGRLHTSTVSVTVLPQANEIDVEIQDKDLRIETKRASGAGGQHVNKTESAVRITHIPTGIAVECQTDRSQIKNRKEAMKKLRNILYKRKIEEQTASALSTRKSQVKSNLRSEKIRTYNYNQDRITDHRVSGNIHNLPEFLIGNEYLDNLIEELESNSKKELLFQRIKEACDHVI
ncbi:hypothetical protein R5R35_004884 [Gryllus longicercus]|uniref:Prokaryotic-type class I peptide chain release factors domain-containing protein n=2 Tax=Gryllus longicercus TaxID=2509291 RepID=A0AAN9Z1H7_9ORTH